MKNFIEQGERIEVTLTAAVVAGQFFLSGALPCVAIISGNIGDTITAMTHGVFSLPKDANAIIQGELIYWDTTNKVMTATSTNNTQIGYAFADAAATDGTVNVYIK